MNLPALLFPDLALIALGWALYRYARWAPSFWEGAEKLVYYVLFPALVFNAIVRSPMSPRESLPMLGVAVAVLLAGVVLGHLGRPLLSPPARTFASGVQCAFRFNTYIALALATRLGGDAGAGLAALIVGVVVAPANFFAVLSLARNSGTGVLRELARNPLVLGTLSGLLCKMAGVSLPEPVDATLQRLGQAALGIGLICVGAGLRLDTDPDTNPATRRVSRAFAVWVTAIKLLAMPALAMLAANAMALPALPRTIVIMFASMPTAPAAYVLTNRMGGDGRYVAQLITISTLCAILTIPLWVSLAAR